MNRSSSYRIRGPACSTAPRPRHACAETRRRLSSPGPRKDLADVAQDRSGAVALTLVGTAVPAVAASTLGRAQSDVGPCVRSQLLGRSTR